MDIRQAINLIESCETKLTETPELIDDTDLGFDDTGVADDRPSVRKSEFFKYMNTKHHVIEKNDMYVLGQTDNSYESDGAFFLANLKTKKIDYVVEYDQHDVPGVGFCVSQSVLWRAPDSIYRNVTKKIFWDVLLKEYSAILTDSMQTFAGKDFWIRRLHEAVAKGLCVGIIYSHDEHDFYDCRIKVYDGTTDLEDWIERYYGWGTDEDHRSIRYFISRNKVAPTMLKAAA